MRNFREFDVWKDGLELVDLIYGFTDNFPKNEMFGLSSQLNRAAVSIVNNIAEGASRTSEKEFARFIEVAIGSAFEVETLLIISERRKLIVSEQFHKGLLGLHSLQKRLNGFRTHLLMVKN